MRDTKKCPHDWRLVLRASENGHYYRCLKCGFCQNEPAPSAAQVCKCGKRIVFVTRDGNLHEYWRLEGSGEVCSDGHWHEPLKPHAFQARWQRR
jgi:hypothetical protein